MSNGLAVASLGSGSVATLAVRWLYDCLTTPVSHHLETSGVPTFAGAASCLDAVFAEGGDLNPFPLLRFVGLDSLPPRWGAFALGLFLGLLAWPLTDIVFVLKARWAVFVANLHSPLRLRRPASLVNATP